MYHVDETVLLHLDHSNIVHPIYLSSPLLHGTCLHACYFFFVVNVFLFPM